VGTIRRGATETNTPAKILAAQRERNALVLRQAGATYTKIAKQLGYRNRSSAADAVTRALARTTPKPLADEVRRLELERLDDLWRSMYPKAVQGDHLAVDRCLRIMARRAALLGLDAPQRVQQLVITDEQLLEAIERWNREAEVLEAAAGFGSDGLFDC
jgi:hypothetical protein